MLKRTSNLQKDFLRITEKSKKECGDKLEEMRKLIFIIFDFEKSVKACEKELSPKLMNSLTCWCYLELVRASAHILFLSYNGLYRNAFDNIRHVLESIVQALYIDGRHPKTPLTTKIEILREVEDKREYHAIRLIDELKIDNKEKLKTEYKELSRVIHPSHKQIIATFTDVFGGRGVPATVDCEEVARIYSSMEKMFDIFFFLFTKNFPEVKESLKKNLDFSKHIKSHNLILLNSSFKSSN
jgi:hypothetical protein